MNNQDAEVLEFLEESDDSGESIELNTKYVNPIKRNAVVGADGAVIDYKNIDPLDVIKKFAEKQGITLKDPKSNCKRCYGRGYVGRLASQGGAPVPCDCIYPPEFRNKTSNLQVENRELRRNKAYQKQKKLMEIAQHKQQLELEKKYENQYSKNVGLPFSDITGV